MRFDVLSISFSHYLHISLEIHVTNNEKDFFVDIKAVDNDVCEGFLFLCRILATFVI
jgi:hypothetical protein